jgi:uncharacterized membrane protein YdjX (TVP38/TMEM64 family)
LNNLDGHDAAHKDSSGLSRKRPLVAYLAPIGFALVLAAAVLSYVGDGLAATLLSTALPASAKVEAVVGSFNAWGALAPVAYILFVTVEVVVAPLPGLMLYAPGGIVFGGFLGGLYALIGNVLGAAIACQTMRILGAEFFGGAIRQRLGRLEPLLERSGMWVIFLLRLNPLTSSDLVSYAAGLTAVPLWKVLLGTALGMAPQCWLQAYLAEGLMEAFPGLLYPLIGACAVYIIVALWILHRMGIGKSDPASTPP